MKVHWIWVVLACLATTAGGAVGRVWFSDPCPPCPGCECSCPPQTVVARIAGPREQPWRLAAPTPVHQAEVGERLPLPDAIWVTVEKATPNFSIGEHCLAERGGDLLVLGKVRPLLVLVRYRQPTGGGGGSTCDGDVLGLLDLVDYSVMASEAADAAQLEAEVAKVLAGAEMGAGR